MSEVHDITICYIYAMREKFVILLLIRVLQYFQRSAQDRNC
jgi:hypothetical protein